ncbi:MAG: hypothetical protein WC002_04535 [Candidatus Muiribacteriota bacterium]
MKKTKYRLKPQKLAFAVLVIIVILTLSYILNLAINHYKNEQLNKEKLENRLQSLVNKDINEEDLNFVLSYIQKFPQSHYNGYAYFIIGKYYYEIEKYDEAVNAFNKALNYYIEDEIKIILMLHLSYTYMLSGDYISSHEYAEKIYNSVESGKLKALAAFQLGLCYAGFKIYDKAIEFFDITYELSDKDFEFQKQALQEKLKILIKVDKHKAAALEKIIEERYNSEAVSPGSAQ